MEEENKTPFEETIGKVGDKLDEIKDDAKEKISDALDTEDETSGFDQADIDRNKVYAILSYFGIFVLLPIFLAKDSRFARFHANQGLILLFCGLIIMALSHVPVIRHLHWIAEIIVFVLLVIGVLNAAGGKAKRLPLVGKFDILK